MASIDKIPNIHMLESLCMISQDIKHLNGLETSLNLKKLWICETLVSKMQGLESLTNLRELYLYLFFQILILAITTK